MNFINKLFFIFSLIFLIAILFVTAIYFPLEENSATQKVVNIPSGTNAKEIVDLLEKNEIIRKNNYTFRILIKLMKLEDQLKFGEYELSPSMNMLQILDKLVKGEVIVYKITIPEGYTFTQIAELLEKKEIAEKEAFLKLVKNGEKTLEGYLFPDTYEVPKKYGAENIVKVILSNFNQIAVENKFTENAEEIGFSLDEIIIEPDEYEKFLKKAYKEATFEKPKNALGFTKKLPSEEVEKLLRDNIIITEDDLRLLAIQRANAVKSFLVETGPVEPERLFIIEPKTGAEGSIAQRVEMIIK